jgi:hypothetical protein
MDRQGRMVSRTLGARVRATSRRSASLTAVTSAFRQMMRPDRERLGLSVARASWLLGVSVRRSKSRSEGTRASASEIRSPHRQSTMTSVGSAIGRSVCVEREEHRIDLGSTEGHAPEASASAAAAGAHPMTRPQASATAAGDAFTAPDGISSKILR